MRAALCLAAHGLFNAFPDINAVRGRSEGARSGPTMSARLARGTADGLSQRSGADGSWAVRPTMCVALRKKANTCASLRVNQASTHLPEEARKSNGAVLLASHSRDIRHLDRVI